MADDILKDSVHEHAGQVQPEAQKTAEQTKEEAIVKEIVDNYAFASSVTDAQRRQEDEDLEFEAGNQWDPVAVEARKEHIDEATQVKITARPTLTINLITQPIQQVLSEARQASLAITVKPKAGLANTKVAGYYKGLIRAIQTDAGAMGVRLWALERASKCGRGAYEILTEFANDGDFDLDIVPTRILDQGSVYWDPYSQKPDKSDAEWCLIVTWMSEDERLRRWPTKPIIETEGAFGSTDHPWFALDSSETGKKRVLVGRYYKVVYEPHVLAYHPQIGSKKLDEMPPEVQAKITAGETGVRTRTVDKRRIVLYVVDGSQVLEESPWMGRYIPVLPVIGKEFFVKGKHFFKGITTDMKDLGRGYNVAISAATETVGAMTKAHWIMIEGQDEGYEEMWDDSAIKNFSRLYIRNISLDGKPAPFPQRQVNEPAIQGTMLLARQFRDDANSIIGSVDAVTRAVRPYDRSGKAIEALQKQGAAGTSNYLDNLATVTMPQEGRIYVDLIPKVYDREGRIIRVMGEENDEETAIMIKRPFVYDDEQNPIPVPCPMCQGVGVVPGQRTFRTVLSLAPPPVVCPACLGLTFATKANMPKEWNGQTVQYVDLSEGEFKVSVAIGRNYATKQEEAMVSMGELAKAVPGLVPLYADVWVRAMGFSGSNEIADRIADQNPAAKKDKSGKTPELPPELMAQVTQLQAEHQAAMQELAKAKQALESDAIKMIGQKELQAMKAEAAAGLEELKQQGARLKIGLEGEQTRELESLRGELERMRQEDEQRHEVLLELLKAKSQEKMAEESSLRSVAADAVKTSQTPPTEGGQ